MLTITFPPARICRFFLGHNEEERRKELAEIVGRMRIARWVSATFYNLILYVRAFLTDEQKTVPLCMNRVKMKTRHF